MKLWYKQPAELWVEALPVGNGRLRAMIYGKTDKEIVSLNEDTLWSGYPRDLNPKNKKDDLPASHAACERKKTSRSRGVL